MMIELRTCELSIAGLEIQRDQAEMLRDLNAPGSAPWEAASLLLRDLESALVAMAVCIDDYNPKLTK